MGDYVEATAHLVVSGKRTYGPLNANGIRSVSEARIARMTANKPQRLEADEVAVKVTIRLPAEVFDPLTPTAVLTIPEDMVQRGVIEIEAGEA